MIIECPPFARRKADVMPFEHACFLSYRRHEQSELAERFIADLHSALRNELLVMMDEDIFVDREGLRGGSFIDPVLAHALCKSVCMIVIYTPTYFSWTHTYCAREYRAMEKLEGGRLARVGNQQDRNAGLIIPVILRGQQTLPLTIRSQRQCYIFEHFALSSQKMARNRQFEMRVREIASVIYARKSALAHLADELTCDCHRFAFPTEDEVRPWLTNMIPSANAFPFR
jgi:hypothetical protein